MLRLAVGAGSALLLSYLALLAALLAARPASNLAGEAIRLLPDLLRFVRRLVRAPWLPRRARVALWCLLAYLAVPLDLVPDVIPVLGYADDVILTGLVLCYVIRRGGSAAVLDLWPGTAAGLGALGRLARFDVPAAALSAAGSGQRPAADSH